jgi:hypothetical protein
MIRTRMKKYAVGGCQLMKTQTTSRQFLSRHIDLDYEIGPACSLLALADHDRVLAVVDEERRSSRQIDSVCSHVTERFVETIALLA